MIRTVELNVGCDIGDTKDANHLAMVVREICGLFPVQSIAARKTTRINTENAIIVLFTVPSLISPDYIYVQVYELAERFHQDAIAAKIQGVGKLIGPDDARWGAFNAGDFEGYAPSSELLAEDYAGRN